MKEAHALAHDNIEVAQSLQAKSYDKNVKILSLKEGDLVLLRDTTTKKGKSYDIIKKISDKIYTIRAHGSKNYKNAKCKH